MWLPHSFIAILFAVLAKGALTNTTVDDTSFTFSGTWRALSTTSVCTSTSENPCPAQPDPTKMHGGTWHAGTIHPGAAAGGSFIFKGSAVYIFGIDQAGQAEIDFTLDNTNSAVHHYTGTKQFAYNALFFSANELTSDQMHTVSWELKATGNAVQYALFDYAMVMSGEEGVPTNGAVSQPVTNSRPNTTQTTTPSDSDLATEPVTPTPSGTGSNAMSSPIGSASAGSITPPPSASASHTPSVDASSHVSSNHTTVPSASASHTPGVDASSHVSSNHTAVIAGITCSLVGVALLLSLFFFIHRCRLKRRPPVNTLPDPMLNTGLYETRPLQPPSKSALDLEMHRAHQQLQALRDELQVQSQSETVDPDAGAVGSQNENAELRAHIQVLTEEVERLRSMGAEAPPAYSM